MWKPNCSEISNEMAHQVSEELSSVETGSHVADSLQKNRFQKNLVVWKRKVFDYFFALSFIVSEELSSVETKNCRIFCRTFEYVSEELSSVETFSEFSRISKTIFCVSEELSSVETTSSKDGWGRS